MSRKLSVHCRRHSGGIGLDEQVINRLSQEQSYVYVGAEESLFSPGYYEQVHCGHKLSGRLRDVNSSSPSDNVTAMKRESAAPTEAIEPANECLLGESSNDFTVNEDENACADGAAVTKQMNKLVQKIKQIAAMKGMAVHMTFSYLQTMASLSTPTPTSTPGPFLPQEYYDIPLPHTTEGRATQKLIAGSGGSREVGENGETEQEEDENLRVAKPTPHQSDSSPTASTGSLFSSASLKVSSSSSFSSLSPDSSSSLGRLSFLFSRCLSFSSHLHDFLEELDSYLPALSEVMQNKQKPVSGGGGGGGGEAEK